MPMKLTLAPPRDEDVLRRCEEIRQRIAALQAEKRNLLHMLRGRKRRWLRKYGPLQGNGYCGRRYDEAALQEISVG